MAQDRGHAVIDFDRGDLGTGLGQSERERAESGADLDHMIRRTHVGEASDAPHGVRIGDEVLTEGASGGQPMFFEKSGDVASGVGHERDLRS